MLTAAEARALDTSAQKKSDLGKLEALIRVEATKGGTFIRVPYDMTNRKGYNHFNTPGVEDALIAAGYKLIAKYEDRQIVDLWVEVHWSEEKQ